MAIDWNRLRKITFPLDAIQIWGPGLAALVAWLLGLLQGLGVALSFLVALAAAPLALVTVLLFKNRQSLTDWVKSQLGSDRSNAEAHEQYGDHYEGAHEQLMLFVVLKLMPACWSLALIQEQILKKAIDNEKVRCLAFDGILNTSDAMAFGNAFKKLGRLSESPPLYIEFDEMIDCVDTIERNYAKSANQANDLANAANINVEIHPLTTDLWQRWTYEHNELVSSYEQIKTNSRMGKLFRPARQSRWGRTVGSASLNLSNQFLVP